MPPMRLVPVVIYTHAVGCARADESSTAPDGVAAMSRRAARCRGNQQLALTSPERNRRYLAERDPDVTVRERLRQGIEEFRRMLEGRQEARP
jgi:hypothetical protein